MTFIKHTYFIICILSLFTLAASFLSCTNHGSVQGSEPVIDFQDTIIDLGSFAIEETKEFDFHFNNIGTSALVIEGVEPGCVCTKVSFPTDSIAPSQGGDIHVVFNGKDRFLPGPHDFYIHVKTNTSKRYIDLLFTTDFINTTD